MYCDKTYQQWWDEIQQKKAEKQAREKEAAKRNLIYGQWYCIGKFDYSSMPLGVGQYGGTTGRSLIFDGYRMVGLKKSDIIAGGFNTKEAAEMWMVENQISPDSYYYDKIKEIISNRIDH